jgi:Actin
MALPSTGTPFLFDKPPLVIDFGHFSVRAGLAGDARPRLEVPVPAFILDCFYGQTAQQCADGSFEVDVSKFLAALFVNDLCIKPADHKMLLVEGSIMPLHLKAAIDHTLSKEMKCPSVMWVRQAAATVLANGGLTSNTALLIDVGWRDTRITPVLQGHAVEGLGQISRCNAFGSRFLAHFTGTILVDGLATRLLELPSGSAESLRSFLVSSTSSSYHPSAAPAALHASSLPAFVSSGGNTKLGADIACSPGASLSSFPATPKPPVEEATVMRQWVLHYGKHGSGDEGDVTPGSKGFISVGDRWLWLLWTRISSSGLESLSNADIVRALNLLSRDGGVAGQILQWSVSVCRSEASRAYSALQREIDGGASSDSTAEVGAAPLPLPSSLVAVMRQVIRAVEAHAAGEGTGSAGGAAATRETGGSPCSIELKADQKALLTSAFRSVLFPEQLELPSPLNTAVTGAGDEAASLHFLLAILSSLSALLRRYCIANSPEYPLHKEIADCLLHCPIDARRQLASSVVFCGGLASAKGFIGSVMGSLLQLIDPTSSGAHSSGSGRSLTARLFGNASRESSKPGSTHTPDASGDKKPSGRYGGLRPLADTLSLGNLHPPCHTVFAGGSIFAAAAASVNVPVPMASISTTSMAAGGSLGLGVPAYAQVTLDRGGRVALSTGAISSSSSLTSTASATIPAVLVDAFSAFASAAATSGADREGSRKPGAGRSDAATTVPPPSTSASPKPTPEASIASSSAASASASGSSGTTSASTSTSTSIAARLAKVQATMMAAKKK